MPNCVKIRTDKTQVCSGDLRYLITINQRTLGVPSDPINGIDVDYTESFTVLHTVRAAISTPQGATLFNDIGTTDVVTHIFYIRYLSDVDAQKWVEFGNNRYDILKVTNYEGRKLFLKLECKERGDINKEATRA